MKITLVAGATALVLGSLLAAPAFAQDAALDTEEAKLSYSLGMMVGERVLKQYGDLDFDILIQAMKAQKDGEQTQISMEEAQATLQKQQEKATAQAAMEASKEGEVFLAENAAREAVTVTQSGLQYEVLTAAEGAKPSVDDTVSVHYVGTLMDGTEFDSSISRGEPASFPLKGVIPGWTEGLQLMNVGSKYRFVIPSELAYGDRGAGQAIGPGATLVFEVELLEIK